MRSQCLLFSTFLLYWGCNAADPAGAQGTGGAATTMAGRGGSNGSGGNAGNTTRGEGGNSAGGQSAIGGAAGSGGVAGGGASGGTSGGAGGGASGGMSGAGGGTSGMNDAGGDAREVGADTGPGTVDTWANFAQAFMGKYCVSCHNDDRAGDAARDYHMLSVVVREKVDIACGTAKSQAERTKRACPTSAPRANQFPAGNGPKPTDDERDRLLRWIDAGTP
ncbi:MAG TPA: hypothetical protein VGG33_26515 [Polyangia bacterium]